MYSNVVYASLWKAMNGFSESIVEAVPIRNTPPSWTVAALPPELPPQAAKISAAAAAASRAAGRCVRSPGRVHVPKCVLVPTSHSRGSSRLAVPSQVLLERTFKVRNPDIAQIGRAHV